MPNGLTNDFAIVVGVDTYSDPGIKVLSGCVNDARLFHAWLTDAGGGALADEVLPAIGGEKPVRRVELICSPGDGTNGRPVKDDIEDAFIRLLDRYLATGTRLGRRLYLWFSGHGISPPGTLEDCALLMANARMIALDRCLPGRRAANGFRHKAMFDEVVLFMDCCRSVSGTSQQSSIIEAGGDPITGQSVRKMYGFATQWAAESAEKLLPDPLNRGGPDFVHGVFTHAVLEGLRKAADPAGQITSTSLATYVRERVVDFLPDDNNQRPEFEFDSAFPIVFATGLASAVTGTEVVLTLTAPGEGFQVRAGTDLQTVFLQRSSPAENPVSLRLEPGLYLFAAPSTGEIFTREQPFRVIGERVHVQL